LNRIGHFGLCFSLVILIVSSGITTRAQSKHAIENGCIVKARYQGKIRGSLVDQNSRQWTVVDYNGDSIRIIPLDIKKVYLPDEITLFKRKRFHYKKGGLLNHSLGLGLGGVHWNLSYNRRFAEKFEIGFGLGVHQNSFYFSTSNSRHDVGVTSFPLYIQGKYILRTGKKLWYGKLRAGWANNLNTWMTYDTTDGLLFEGGLGVTFKSKTRMKRYFEVTQYFSRASGMARSAAQNGLATQTVLSDIGFKVWFVNFMVTYGIEIGR